MLRIIINEKFIKMKSNKIILIILIGFLFYLIIGCGYTLVKKSTKTSEYTNTQQNYSYTLSGLWTKRKNTNSKGSRPSYVDYYLLFSSDGRYGFSMQDRAPNLSENYYYLDSDTLTFATESFISKYQFSRDGQYLILKFISLERLDVKYMLPNLEGAWSPSY